jgi:predicted N-acetyltransferase YhbS
MEIRPAEESDIPEIIQVLKSSLGESLMPKSMEFWNWKHEQNPFGKSPVLLAVSDGKIVGIRAFLTWKWETQGKEWRSLRAVDTAVLPEFQGKGIFSKLTREMLSDCTKEGYHFVFNTPNKKSLPGYLKMGWKKAGRLPIQLQFHNLKPYKKPITLPPLDLDVFENLAERAQSLSEKVHTQISKDFLLWRYAHCPIAHYQILTDQKSYLLIFRIKSSPLGKELRVADIFGLDKNGAMDIKSLQKELLLTAKELGVNFTAYLPSEYTPKILSGIGKIPAMPIGPQLTLRNLTLSEDFAFLLQTKNWGYTLGDLEVF